MLHGVPVLALEVSEKFGVARNDGAVGAARAPIASGEQEPGLPRGPPLRGEHLNCAKTHKRIHTILVIDAVHLSGCAQRGLRGRSRFCDLHKSPKELEVH